MPRLSCGGMTRPQVAASSCSRLRRFRSMTANTRTSPMAKITIVSNTTNSSVHRDKKPKLGSSVSHQADLCFVETGNCLGSLRWKVVVSISLRPVDNQDGRRFSGPFSSERGDDNFVAVISRNSTIFLMDDDGY